MQAMDAPFLSSLKPLKSRRRRRQRVGGGVVSARAGSNGGEYRGKMVDENMIVLRMRISEIKMSEEGQRSAPSDWTEWEKQYGMGYNEMVFEVVGMLQTYLMDVRPCLGVGLMALVALSLGASSWVVFVHALNMSRDILSMFLS